MAAFAPNQRPMIKPASLRAAITKLLPSLERDPDKLNLWIDEGRVRSWLGSLNFEYSYQLNISVEGFTHEPSAVMIIIVEWLKAHQPDLLADKDKEGFRFVVDIIDDSSVDISIELDLMEKVIVTEGENGAHHMQHVSEPNPIFPDDEPCSIPPTPLKEVYKGDKRIIPNE